jgi:hypothetical protein
VGTAGRASWLRRAVFIGLAIGLASVGSLGAWLILRPVSPVTVVVRNGTTKPIASVRLEHERGVEILENLPQGEARTIRFRAGGETSYKLQVHFVDGSELSGEARYAEAGYSFTETVGDTSIVTDTRLSY